MNDASDNHHHASPNTRVCFFTIHEGAMNRAKGQEAVFMYTQSSSAAAQRQHENKAGKDGQGEKPRKVAM